MESLKDKNILDLPEEETGAAFCAWYRAEEWRRTKRLEQALGNIPFIFIGGGLAAIPIGISMLPHMKQLGTAIIYLTLMAIFISLVRGWRRRRAIQRELDADPLWQRASLIMHCMKGYSALHRYYEAWTEAVRSGARRESKAGATRFLAFLVKAHDILTRAVVRFNTVISLQQRGRSAASWCDGRTARAESPDLNEAFIASDDLHQLKREIHSALLDTEYTYGLPGHP